MRRVIVSLLNFGELCLKEVEKFHEIAF